MTSLEKRIYGLVGYPVRHSLSPLMHNAAFSYLKMDAEYMLFEKKPDELGGFLNSLGGTNIHGLNVTVPYKEKTIPFLDSLSDEAKLIGAVNTVRVSGGKLEGFNTDAEGFLKHLVQDLGFNPQDKVIAIIGAGGASRAVSVSLSKASAKGINIYDIDKIKAEALANDLKRISPVPVFKAAAAIEELEIGKCSLLVNATPVGLKDTDPLLIKEKLIHRNLLVYDLIYNPQETKLLRVAKGRGAQTSNGLGMLLYQGALSFEIFSGKPAPVTAMREALSQGVKNL